MERTGDSGPETIVDVTRTVRTGMTKARDGATESATPSVAARRATPSRASDAADVIRAINTLTDDGLVVVRGDETIGEANHAALALLGLPAGARVSGRPIADILDEARLRDSLGLPIRGQDAWSRMSAPLGLRVRRSSRGVDEQRVLRLTMAELTVDGRVVLIRDLTPLVAAEDLGYRFRRAVELTLDGVLLAAGPDLLISYANAAAVRQTDWPRESLVGRPLADVLPRTDVSLGDSRGWSGGQVGDVAGTVLRTRAGRLVPVDASIQQIADGGDGGSVMAVIREATQRIESQVRLQRLVQQERVRAGELEATLAGIGDAVIVCDREGRVLLANPATHDVFPHRTIDSYAALMAGIDDPTGIAPRLGGTERQGPVELRRAGTDRWVQFSAFPLHGAFESMAGGTIILARDATLARDARGIRETFLGILSHELRTPITTILGGIKVLRRHEEADFPLRGELHEDIEAEAERLYRLVEDLLVLARIEDDQVEPMMDEPLLLRRMLPALLASEEARWPGRQFEFTVPPDLTVVQGDRTYLEQILRNLLGNAAKYSPAGQPIEIRVEPADDEVGVLVLDRGPGLEPDEAERLFDLYYRSPRTQGIAGGAGIGLFVCRILVEAMGGRVWARPREGGGAEFGFALKILREESE
ncbi:MAG TPA: ATP-binding protein [Candidatus Limnocylindrales bacterium]